MTIKYLPFTCGRMIYALLLTLLLTLLTDNALAQPSSLQRQVTSQPALQTVFSHLPENNQIGLEDPNEIIQLSGDTTRNVGHVDDWRTPTLSLNNRLLFQDWIMKRYPLLQGICTEGIVVSGSNPSYINGNFRGKRKWTHFNSWGKRNGGSVSKICEELVNKWENKKIELGQGDKEMDKEEISGISERELQTEEEIRKNEKAMTDFWDRRDNSEIEEKDSSHLRSLVKRETYLDNHLQEWNLGNNIRGSYNDIQNEKKWTGLTTWGKRQEDIGNEKKWKEMGVWGKREPGGSTELAHLEALGKRLEPKSKWTSISAWGKRNAEKGADKKWKEMSVWGKRDNTDFDSILGNEHELRDIEKRRDMAVWDYRNKLNYGARAESGNWGKRTNRHVRNWRDMDMWGKRPSWSKTGFTSWGKRSGNSVLSHRQVKRESQSTQTGSSFDVRSTH